MSDATKSGHYLQMSKQTVYVLNLDRRPDRWIQCQRLWGQWFDLVRFPAMESDNGARGCKASHAMVADNYLKEHEFIIVMEDDCLESSWFETIGMLAIEEAKHHITEWDACMCGAFLDLSPIGMRRASLFQTSSPLWVKSDYGHQTHMMLYNQRSLQLLNDSLHTPTPIDMYIGTHAKDLWIPARLLAVQSESESDIRIKFPGEQGWYERSDEMLSEVISDDGLDLTLAALGGTRT